MSAIGIDRRYWLPFSKSFLKCNFQRQFQAFFAPDEWWARSKPYLTVENFVRCTKLALLLGLAAANGLYYLAGNLLPALNKTLLALGTLIQKATPFLLACLDTVNKVHLISRQAHFFMSRAPPNILGILQPIRLNFGMSLPVPKPSSHTKFEPNRLGSFGEMD